MSSVDEEDTGAGQGGQGVGHLADSGVVDESSKEEQEAYRTKRWTMRHREEVLNTITPCHDLAVGALNGSEFKQ